MLGNTANNIVLSKRNFESACQQLHLNKNVIKKFPSKNVGAALNRKGDKLTLCFQTIFKIYKAMFMHACDYVPRPAITSNA